MVSCRITDFALVAQEDGSGTKQIHASDVHTRYFI